MTEPSAISPAIMARASLVSTLRWMYRFNGNKPLVRYGRRFNYMDRGVLDNLINVLAVSRTALVIRLTQLGYICQRPESEYCDPLDVFPNPGEVF